MSVWIMVGGMQGVSYAIEEAAQIDGASKWYIYFLSGTENLYAYDCLCGLADLLLAHGMNILFPRF